MTDTAYERRLRWAARLLRDVTDTLGHEAGAAWGRNHRAALKQDLAAVQREWNEEKARLRVGAAAPDGDEGKGRDARRRGRREETTEERIWWLFEESDAAVRAFLEERERSERRDEPRR